MEQSIQTLIESAKNGKPQAQSKLMDLFWNDVKGYLLYKTNNENLAEELTVETFTKAISKLSLYDENFNFKTWLISIAQNNLIDYFRSQQKNENTIFSDDYDFLLMDIEPSPEEILIDKQNISELEQKLGQLPEKYSEVLRLRFLDDLSIAQIAEKKSLTESNVKVRIMRAKKLLQDIWNES